MATGAPEAAPPVLTFLIADVRGYTRFTVEHGDEAAAKLAVRFAAAAREVATAREGRVVELRGDEVLCVFPSTRRALWASTELNARLLEESDGNPPIPIGVGLDAGEAIPVDGGYRGAALNLAARLCSLAGPGEILASETVTNLARKTEGLAYSERGLVTLKGFADPVKVMEIRPFTAQPTEADIEALPSSRRRGGAGGEGEQILPIGGFLGSLPDGPLVARDAALHEILAVVDIASAGRGQTVLLAGEPGAGKTRLAQEVTLALRNRGFLIAAGRCYEAEQTVPYYPFLDALAMAYAAAPSHIQRDAARRWPYLTVLLPDQLGVQEVAGGGQEEQRLFFAVTSFLQAISEDKPVAVLLDDLHLADPATLKLLQYLARHTRSSRVFILGAYRDVEVNRRHPLEGTLRELDREGLMQRLAVRRLDQDGTAALMAATMGEEEISDEFAGLVYGRTEGNPFFVQQVLRTLVERGDVYREAGRWERKAVEAIDVPESVRSVIGQRLERLHEGTQAVLAEASVLGQTFAVQELLGLGERSSHRSEVDVEEALDEAEGTGLLRETGREVYAFDHALTQQTLYGELSSRRRRRLHLAAGEAIEALPERKRRTRTAELSRHFLDGDELSKAATYTAAAAEEAAAVFAQEEAESHFRTALELAPEIGDRALEARALTGLGRVLGIVSRYAEALETLTSAAELYREMGDREAEMGAEAEIGRVHLNLGEADTGIERLEAALAQARERGDPAEGSRALAAATSTLARLYWIKGDLEPALSAATLAADLARAAGDNRVLAEAETRRGTVLESLGRKAEAEGTLDNAIAIAEEAGALDVVATAANNATFGPYWSGRWDRTERYHRLAIAAVERAGDPDQLAFTLRGLAFVLIDRGAWREAREHAERAVRLSDAVGDSWGRPQILSPLAWLNVLEGRWGEAEPQFAEAWQLAQSHDDLTAKSTVLWVQGWLSILQGHAEQLIERAEPLLDTPRTDPMYHLILQEHVARAWIELGDVARAEALARQAVELARQEDARLMEATALPTLGRALARKGRIAEAQETFERALELSRAMPHPFNEAVTHYEWGCMLAGTGDEAGARKQLDAALDLFRQLGANPFAELTERALASI